MSGPTTSQLSGQPPTAGRYRPRVLVCDSSDAARQAVSRLLEPEYECRLAASGAEALARAREFLPDVIVADLLMPGTEGQELPGALRQQPALAGIPLLVLVSASELESLAEELDPEVDDYLVKPVRPREFLARVRSLVLMRRAMDDLEERAGALESSRRSAPATRPSLARGEALATVGTMVAGLANEASGSLACLKSGVTSTLASLTELRRELEHLVAAVPETERERLGRACQVPLAEAFAILGEMTDDSARLERVTRDLRTVAGSERAPVEEVDLEAEVERAWVAAAAADGRPRFSLEGGGDTAIRSVRHLVASALGTVLQNAAEAAGPEGLVRVALEPARDGVLISVHDSGPDILPEQLPRIFDSFFTAKPNGAARGRGLAVTYGILHGLGGCIDATSEPGAGATFRLWMPRTCIGLQATGFGPRPAPRDGVP